MAERLLFIPGAFDSWELIQAQELRKKLLMKQDLQQLNADVSDTITWLKNTEAELETLKTAKPPSDAQELGLRVKRLKVRPEGGAEGCRVRLQALAVLTKQTKSVEAGCGGWRVAVPLPFHVCSWQGHGRRSSFSFRRASTGRLKARRSAGQVLLRCSVLGSLTSEAPAGSCRGASGH